MNVKMSITVNMEFVEMMLVGLHVRVKVDLRRQSMGILVQVYFNFKF